MLTRTRAILVPTCERDKWFSDLAVEGIRKFWPDMLVVELYDTDTSTETTVPDDIRTLCRAVPYLRKQIDGPYIVGTDDLWILDSDCFMFKRPGVFDRDYSYQGRTLYGNNDYPWGLRVWKELGHSFPVTSPLFCAGMFSAPITMWTDNRELSFDYLRHCVKRGYHRRDWQYSCVTMDQSLAAGLWRKTCPDNPLPALEYPLGIPTTVQEIFHACYFKRAAAFKPFIERYKRHLAT